jgi:hypothetical protein
VTLRPAPYQPAGSKPSLDLTVPREGLVVSAPEGARVALYLRRFASAFPTQALGVVAGGATATIRIPPDRASLAWHLRLEPAGAVTACEPGKPRS